MIKLSLEQWQHKAAEHRERAQQWTLPALKRRSCNQPNPVEDFLFEYYPFHLTKLEHWHPGLGTMIECPENITPPHFKKNYQRQGDWLHVAPELLENKEAARLFWTLDLLKRTATRPANFSCHGVHEWAMVYKATQVRHQATTPLRLPSSEIDKFVESRNIRCSHFDAFRFFTPEAKPFNSLSPTLDTRHQNEQPGCIHANMDLYKWTHKCLPWVSGEILLDSFALAMELREIDMRASPYDLSAYGYEPICIETPEGRKNYEYHQKKLSEKSQILRAKLIAQLELLSPYLTLPCHS